MAEEKAPPPAAATPGGEAKAKDAPAKVEGKDASGHPWVESLRSGVPDSVVSAREYARQVSVVVAQLK